MKKRHILRWFGAAAVVALGWIGFAYLTLPDVRPLAGGNPATTAFIELRAREAHALGRPAKRVQRWVPYSRISPHLKRAVIVAEDAAFWQHEGVDYDELQKAMELGFVRGASTITQQLAKNLYLSPSRNPVRKFRELIITRRLEAELEKARIFEIYLNVIEWGDGVYGAEAAARTYFGVPAAAVGPSQAAIMAAALINPRLLNIAQPSPRLTRRQQLILRRMGAVTPPEQRTPVPHDPIAPPLPDQFAPLPGQAGALPDQPSDAPLTSDETAPLPDPKR
jgi:monofunctional biosynthetic peptidoglycan transglycosylase